MTRDEPGIPAVHALHLAEVVERLGVARARLFDGLGLDEDRLADPTARLGVRTVETLVERARELSGEPAIGVHLGLQMRVSAHGYLGFAAMAASTAGEALRLAERFARTRTDALALRLEVDRHGGVASLVVEERASFGRARDAVLLALLVGIERIGRSLTGAELRGVAELAVPEPSYWPRFAAVADNALAFGKPENRLVFDASVLDLPLVMADPAALRLAREHCERELARLGGEGFAARVRALVAVQRGGYPSVDEAARALSVSARTLKRRLADEGTDYSSLVDDERRRRALDLLEAAERSVDAVAAELGYSDVANFTRAFRRWTGMTPAAYRKSRRA